MVLFSMALMTGMTRMKDIPRPSMGASISILLRVYSSKHSPRMGYFSHISLLLSMPSMMPGTQMG